MLLNNVLPASFDADDVLTELKQPKSRDRAFSAALINRNKTAPLNVEIKRKSYSSQNTLEQHIPLSPKKSPVQSSTLRRLSTTLYDWRFGSAAKKGQNGSESGPGNLLHKITKLSIANKQIQNDAERDARYNAIKRSGRIVIQLAESSEFQSAIPYYLTTPNATWRQIWDVLISFLVFYYALATPINMAFAKSPVDILSVEIVFNFLFIVDIVLQFFATYEIKSGPDQGRLECNHVKIIKKYLSGWFIIDVLASVPFDIVLWTTTGETSGFNLKILRLTRSIKLMRLFRINRIYKRLEYKIKINVSFVRVVKMMFILFFVWHWIACSYWLVCSFEDSFVPNDLNERFSYGWAPFRMVETDYTFGEQYNIAFFWAVVSSTGIGKDIAPETQLQHSFTTSVIIIGVLIYATIIGSVGTALSSIDTPSVLKKRRIDSVKQYFLQRGIDEELTSKVVNYYEYCHDRHILTSQKNILKDVHPTLKDQLDLEMNKQLLNRVERFQDLPEAILLMLIHSLESRIYLPHEIVYLIGEQATDMYFCVRGDLKLLDFDGSTKKYMSDGDYFGEDFLQLNGKRKYTVTSLGHSELLVLSKTNMNIVSKAYPQFALILFKWSHDQKWASLNKWKRIQFAVETLKNIKLQHGYVENSITFSQTYRHLNGAQEVEEDDDSVDMQRSATCRLSTLAQARMSVMNQGNSTISYDEFTDLYSKFFVREYIQEHDEEDRCVDRTKRMKIIQEE